MPHTFTSGDCFQERSFEKKLRVATQSSRISNGSLLQSTSLEKKPSAGILTTSRTISGARAATITTTESVLPPSTAPTTAPAAAAITTTRSRQPLQLRDQNASPAIWAVKLGPETKSYPSTAIGMPSYERASATGQRQPTLAKAVNKPPLTPKIAARPQTGYHAVLATTPLARRPNHESSLTVNGTASRDKDELASSVPAFLSSNITPRSGSRQNRVDSANSTPTGTPNPDRHDHGETTPFGPDDTVKRPMVTFSPASDAGSGGRADRESKFFYASEAQKQSQPVAQTRQVATQQQRPATFFYANGNTLPERQDVPTPGSSAPSLPSPSSNSSNQDNIMSKFVYANGIPELQPPAKIGPSSKRASGSVTSAVSRVPAGRQGNPQRAPSPIKHLASGGPKSPSAPIIASPRSPVSVTNNQSGTQPCQARLSAEIHRRPSKSHAQPKSPGIADAPLIVAKRLSSHSSAPSSGSTSPSVSSYPASSEPAASSGFASLLQAAEDFTETDETKSESLNSSNKTPQESQLTDLVVSARRERKVQDLEITNASLEAINRTLERQLRKQTAELRRYKRLSRSGRLSIGSFSVGNRVPSDSTVDGGALARAGMGLDDLSEEQSEIEAEDAELEELEEEEDDDVSGSEVSGDESNPGSIAMRDSRHRRRDERRLQLDLLKHQQLLIDSQKINQSLKRCLGWTEELIKEGKRALAYQVRVSDVELGGRVLPPEEIERREAEAAALADDADADPDAAGDEEGDYEQDALAQPDPQLLGMELLAEPDVRPWGKDPQDRDSGIELPADGG